MTPDKPDLSGKLQEVTLKALDTTDDPVTLAIAIRAQALAMLGGKGRCVHASAGAKQNGKAFAEVTYIHE